MKLYRVKVEYQICVLAENNKEAKQVANSLEARDEVEDHINILCEIKHKDNVPYNWLDDEPYSKYLPRYLKDKTVREILERNLLEPNRRRNNANNKSIG